MWQISRPPCKWFEFGQILNDQLGHTYKIGDWKTAESYQLKFYQLKWQKTLHLHFSSIPCKTAEIAVQIVVVLAYSNGPTEHLPKKKISAQSHGRLLK